MAAADAGERARRRAARFLAANLGAPSFDRAALSGLRLLSASPGRVACSLAVGPQLQNRYGTLHGGAIGACAQRSATGQGVLLAAVQPCRCRPVRSPRARRVSHAARRTPPPTRAQRRSWTSWARWRSSRAATAAA
jgi:hypothetical protein